MYTTTKSVLRCRRSGTEGLNSIGEQPWTLEQRMGWVEQRQGTSDYRVQALQDSMIGLNRFSLKLDRKFDTLEENIAAVARDL